MSAAIDNRSVYTFLSLDNACSRMVIVDHLVENVGVVTGQGWVIVVASSKTCLRRLRSGESLVRGLFDWFLVLAEENVLGEGR